jgi:regulator of chromosome condensation
MCIVQENASLFAWGENSTGALGINSNLNQHEPQPVLIGPVQHVSCGNSHTGAITLDNLLFMWGSNSCGELGLGKISKSVLVPTLIECISDCVDVSCSVTEKHAHSLAITKTPELTQAWACGSDYKLKLGIKGNPTQEFYPAWQEIAFFRNKNITKIRAGGIHSIALCDNQLYSWGCGSDGRLGHPEFAGHRYLYKEPVPKLVQALQSTQVLDVSTSYYHAACLALPFQPE